MLATGMYGIHFSPFSWWLWAPPPKYQRTPVLTSQALSLEAMAPAAALGWAYSALPYHARLSVIGHCRAAPMIQAYRLPRRPFKAIVLRDADPEPTLGGVVELVVPEQVDLADAAVGHRNRRTVPTGTTVVAGRSRTQP